MLSCKPRNSVIPGHDLGGTNGIHANSTPGAVWMSRRRVTCLIQLDHSPFWPIGVHIGHVDTPRCSWVCVGMKTNPQDRPGGLSDRPGVPTERLSRHISIGIDSYDTKGYYPAVLKRSSYIYIYIYSIYGLRYAMRTLFAVIRAASCWSTDPPVSAAPAWLLWTLLLLALPSPPASMHVDASPAGGAG